MPQPNRSRRPVIIVSDATEFGDDGVAIALLLASGLFDPRLVVATSGNLWQGEVCANLSTLLARFGRADIPVIPGLPPSAHHRRREIFEMAERSRPDIGFAGALRLAQTGAAGEPPPGAAARVFMAALGDDRPDIILLGPATILAAALDADPGLAARIGQVYAMGGAIAVPGNATGPAEFNVWFDPEAAEKLLASSLPLTLVPLDATDGAVLPLGLADTMDRSRPFGAYLAEYLARRQSTKATPQPLWDEVLAASLIAPELIARSTLMKLAVETAPGANYGACRQLPAGAPRRAIRVVLDVNRAGLAPWIAGLLSAAP